MAITRHDWNGDAGRGYPAQDPDWERLFYPESTSGMIYRNGKSAGTVPLEHAGATSQFAGKVDLRDEGAYELADVRSRHRKHRSRPHHRVVEAAAK